jgi:hypothetical protein
MPRRRRRGQSLAASRRALLLGVAVIDDDLHRAFVGKDARVTGVDAVPPAPAIREIDGPCAYRDRVISLTDPRGIRRDQNISLACPRPEKHRINGAAKEVVGRSEGSAYSTLGQGRRPPAKPDAPLPRPRQRSGSCLRGLTAGRRPHRASPCHCGSGTRPVHPARR